MRLNFCDRCGLQGGERRTNEQGVRVVRVTMQPMARVMDLCGACRSALPDYLDLFLASAPDERPPDSVFRYFQRLHGLPEVGYVEPAATDGAEHSPSAERTP